MLQDYSTTTYNYATLMQQAENCPNRKEALHLIRQASKLREMTALTKPKVFS